MVDEPCGGIAHAQVPLERQRRQTGLGLADQVDRQKPHGQRELGALQHGAGNEGSLMSAGVALVDLVKATAKNAMSGVVATRAAKTARPPRRLQRNRALRLVAVALEELRHRQTGLKLDSIHRHDALPLDEMECRVDRQWLTR